jgi:hypothetical protein
MAASLEDVSPGAEEHPPLPSRAVKSVTENTSHCVKVFTKSC